MPIEELTREQSENIRDLARILHSEYILQIPSHSSYLVSFGVGFTGLELVVLGLVQFLNPTQRLVSLLLASGILICLFGYLGLRYGLGRLLYYQWQINILNEILGLGGVSAQQYYLSLFTRLMRDTSYLTLPAILQGETIYRLKYGYLELGVKDGKLVQAGRKKKEGFRVSALKHATNKIGKKEDVKLVLQKIDEIHKDQGNSYP